MDPVINRELKAALILLFGTQEDAAEELAIDQTKLSKIIRGRRTPHSEEIEKFERVLGKRVFRKCFRGIDL